MPGLPRNERFKTKSVIFIGGFHHDKVKPQRPGILILCQVSHLEQLLPNRLCFQQGWIRAAFGICQSHLAALFSWFQKQSKTFQNRKHVTERCNSEPRNSTQFSYSTARCTCFVACFHCFKVHAMVDPVHIHASRTTAPVGTS